MHVLLLPPTSENQVGQYIRKDLNPNRPPGLSNSHSRYYETAGQLGAHTPSVGSAALSLALRFIRMRQLTCEMEPLCSVHASALGSRPSIRSTSVCRPLRFGVETVQYPQLAIGPSSPILVVRRDRVDADKTSQLIPTSEGKKTLGASTQVPGSMVVGNAASARVVIPGPGSAIRIISIVHAVVARFEGGPLATTDDMKRKWKAQD